MIDRPHLEIDRLEAAEGAFGGRELFVGGDRRGLIEHRFGDSGAHHINALECGFGLDFGGLARKGETVVSDKSAKPVRSSEAPVGCIKRLRLFCCWWID